MTVLEALILKYEDDILGHSGRTIRELISLLDDRSWKFRNMQAEACNIGRLGTSASFDEVAKAYTALSEFLKNIETEKMYKEYAMSIKSKKSIKNK